MSWTETLLESLSLERRVGQLFAPRADSFYAAEDSDAFQRLVRLTAEFGVGGFVLFQGDVFGQAMVVRALQERAEVPLLFGQDAEWGIGMRLFDATTFPSMAAIAASRDKRHAYEVGRVTAAEARALGVFHVYAPVADVNNNPKNPIINVRSFGEDVGLVRDFAGEVIRGLQDGGVLATAKHFPGHGDTAVDSHADLPELAFDEDRLQSLEWVPFKAAIEAGVDSIMVGHLAMTSIDGPDAGPASLSRRVVTGILREQLGYDGLVVSDALDMQGVQKQFDPGEAAVRCVEAGVDVLLTSPDDEAAFAAVLKAVDKGRISAEQLDASVKRILEAKERVNLVGGAVPDIRAVRSIVASGEHVKSADQAAAAGVTLLKSDGTVPLPDRARVLVITLNDTDRPTDRTRAFLDALSRDGKRESIDHVELCRTVYPDQEREVLDKAESVDVVVIASVVAVRSFSGQIGLPEDHGRLVGKLAERKPPVFVALGSPYVIPDVDGHVGTVVLGYGHAPCMQRACVDVIRGRLKPTGTLPLTLSGEFRFGDGIVD